MQRFLTRWSGVFAPLLAGGLAASCTTTDLNSDEACAPVNVNLAAVKDEGAVNKITGHIDTAMNDLMTAAGAGSCSVVFVAGDTIKTINGYGDPRPPGSTHSIPSTWPASTPYYIGSIAKTITAFAMLQMIEDNPYMSLDDPISEHLPGFDLPSGWGVITIRQLLSHTSGAAKDPTSIDSEASLIAAFPNAGPHPGIHPRYAFESYKDNIPAGLSFGTNLTARYSNIGYSLIGAIIDVRASQGLPADASGYERYTYENVALNQNKLSAPAMTSLCLGTSWRAAHIKNLASSNPSSPSSPGDVFGGNGWEGPSGGWTMTVGDLGRLMIIINKNKRLDPATTVEMMTAQGADSTSQMESEAGVNSVAQYALGVAVEPNLSTKDFFAKGGDITGYTSNFKYRGDADVGAGILCSKENVPHAAITDAIDEILAPCLDDDPPSFCSAIGGLTGG